MILLSKTELLKNQNTSDKSVMKQSYIASVQEEELRDQKGCDKIQSSNQYS